MSCERSEDLLSQGAPGGPALWQKAILSGAWNKERRRAPVSHSYGHSLSQGHSHKSQGQKALEVGNPYAEFLMRRVGSAERSTGDGDECYSTVDGDLSGSILQLALLALQARLRKGAPRVPLPWQGAAAAIEGPLSSRPCLVTWQCFSELGHGVDK